MYGEKINGRIGNNLAHCKNNSCQPRQKIKTCSCAKSKLQVWNEVEKSSVKLKGSKRR